MRNGRAPRDRAAGEFARERLHHRDLERLARIERRQNAGQALRQHRLARAGRPDHQHVVAAGGGDLERALGGLLSLHVAQVRSVRRLLRELRRRRVQDLHALHVIDERDERRRGDDLDAAGPGRFRSARGRTDQSALLFARGKRGGQHAGDRRQLRIERQFAERDIVRHLARRQHAHRGQQSQRDGQIVVAAFLGQIGRRQIHRDALIGQRQSDGRKRGAHALLAFATALSARPTMLKTPVPPPSPIWTWTSTSRASIPWNATV